MVYHSGNQLVDPHLIFEKAHVQEGMHVADLGCGRTGHVVFPMSPVVGEKGLIYAVDILKDVLENITKRARMEGIHNIHTVWSDIEQVGGTSIPEKSIDVVFFVNTLVQTQDRRAALSEGARLTKDKARMVIVDWVTPGLTFSPPQEQFVDFADVQAWARDNNFIVTDMFEAGPYHRGMVLYRHE